MDEIEQRRFREVNKYCEMYRRPEYHLGADREDKVFKALSERSGLRDSYLDVGCGRGESLSIARSLGYRHVVGVDPVPSLLQEGVVLAHAHELPFGDRSFQTVSCFDVLEHLIEEDVEAAVRELGRVAERRVLISVGLKPEVMGRIAGVGPLHITLRPEAQWDADFERWLREWKVVRRDEFKTVMSSFWEATR